MIQWYSDTWWCMYHVVVMPPCFSNTGKDDCGKEGVLVLPESDVKQVRVGAKQASESVKRSEHETFQSAKETHEKHAEMLKLDGNDEETWRLQGEIQAASFCRLPTSHLSPSCVLYWLYLPKVLQATIFACPCPIVDTSQPAHVIKNPDPMTTWFYYCHWHIDGEGRWAISPIILRWPYHIDNNIVIIYLYII